jgi:hypothetical protein
MWAMSVERIRLGMLRALLRIHRTADVGSREKQDGLEIV